MPLNCRLALDTAALNAAFNVAEGGTVAPKNMTVLVLAGETFVETKYFQERLSEEGVERYANACDREMHCVELLARLINELEETPTIPLNA